MKFNPLWNPTQLTCQIVIGNWPASKGIQKITGFARGLAFHRVDYFPYFHIGNSIVLGYNRDSDISPIRLFMYAYVDGKLIDPKKCFIGEFEVGVEIEVDIDWRNYDPNSISINLNDKYNDFLGGTHYATNTKTLPIGYQLFPYAEIDGAETKMKFEVEIKDLKIK